MEEVLRKRGFLRGDKGKKRVPIENNVQIEELLGEQGVICVEDVVEAFWRCGDKDSAYDAVRRALWPMQVAGNKNEKKAEGRVLIPETGKEAQKSRRKVEQGGYLGFMGKEIDAFVRPLI